MLVLINVDSPPATMSYPIHPSEFPSDPARVFANADEGGEECVQLSGRQQYVLRI